MQGMNAAAAVPEHPVPRDDLVFRQLDEEWVVFDPLANTLHVLNLAAALVWTHCDGQRSVTEIVEAVRSAFGEVPAGTDLDRDVTATLASFRELGLLV